MSPHVMVFSFLDPALKLPHQRAGQNSGRLPFDAFHSLKVNAAKAFSCATVLERPSLIEFALDK